MTLDARVAADLMVPQVVSISATASVQDAVALLTERNISAVPVVDRAGQPVGVLSRSDIVAHDCAGYEYLQPGPHSEAVTRVQPKRSRDGCIEKGSNTHVRDIMTPVLFSVAPETPANTVVDALLSLSVHRLFVTNRDGAVVGVISAVDILKHLQSRRSVSDDA